MGAPQDERKFADNGARFVAVGAPLVVVGVVVAILFDGPPRGIGITIASLAAIPVVVGLALLLIAWVSRRYREGKPFA
jgi:hypothetical protein